MHQRRTLNAELMLTAMRTHALPIGMDCYHALNVLVCFLVACCASAASARVPAEPNVVIQWDNAALQAVRDSRSEAPIVARALAIVHTCIYDAWAAYDDRAVGTQLRSVLRRPTVERIISNKEKA